MTADHAGAQVIVDKLGRAAVIVPIKEVPRVLGGLVFVGPDPSLYRPADVLLVKTIAGLLALERQRLDQQARVLAVVEERNRLARKILDTLAQSLTAIINHDSLKPYNKSLSQAEADVLAETEGYFLVLPYDFRV